MINNIRYVERTVSQNFGDSIKDLEDTNYWELLEILSAKGDKQKKRKPKSNTGKMNAWEFLQHHAL